MSISSCNNRVSKLKYASNNLLLRGLFWKFEVLDLEAALDSCLRLISDVCGRIRAIPDKDDGETGTDAERLHLLLDFGADLGFFSFVI